MAPAQCARDNLVRATKELARPFGRIEDLRELADSLRKARIVVLGSPGPGAQEVHHWRRILTELLLLEGRYDFLAIDAEWSACRPVQRYILPGRPNEGESLRRTLASFQPWPAWRWANAETLHLLEWLRGYNEQVSSSDRVGLFGLDVHSFFDSALTLRTLVEQRYPFLSRSLRAGFEALADGGGEASPLAAKYRASVPDDFVRLATGVLRERMNERLERAIRATTDFEERQFERTEILDNRDVQASSQKFFRALAAGEPAAWDYRCEHVADMLNRLLERYGRGSRAIVWAFNGVAGDARAGRPGERSAVSLGSIARRRYGRDEVALVGFGVNHGTLTAAKAWGERAETWSLPAAAPHSYECAFHLVGAELRQSRLFARFDERSREGPLAELNPGRGLSLISEERYQDFALANRYDAFVYFDHAHALEPLPAELPETARDALDDVTRGHRPRLPNQFSA